MVISIYVFAGPLVKVHRKRACPTGKHTYQKVKYFYGDKYFSRYDSHFYGLSNTTTYTQQKYMNYFNKYSCLKYKQKNKL